jgi:hypothetical protein
MEGGMARFVISSGVKRLEGGKFVAVASATPCDVSERSGPDERSCVCETEEAARHAELDLASELSYEVNARGDRVVDIQVHC